MTVLTKNYIGSTSDTTLNFNPTYLVTGIDLVEDQLFFTDDFNPPRVINVKRNYANPVGNVDQFTAEELLVIKKPPVEAPTFTLNFTPGEEDYLEERFICFGYRYKYADNQYSATSQFSEPAFSPKPFSFSRLSKNIFQDFKTSLGLFLFAFLLIQIPTK